jgi:hypothetical protein
VKRRSRRKKRKNNDRKRSNIRRRDAELGRILIKKRRSGKRKQEINN